MGRHFLELEQARTLPTPGAGADPAAVARPTTGQLDLLTGELA